MPVSLAMESVFAVRRTSLNGFSLTIHRVFLGFFRGGLRDSLGFQKRRVGLKEKSGERLLFLVSVS
jgi:hypothetical protein